MKFKVRNIFTYGLALIIMMALIIGVDIYNIPKAVKIQSENETVEEINENIEDVTTNEETDDSETSKSLYFSNGYDCVEYAVNILDNGLGFKSIVSLSLTCEILGISAVQYDQETIISSGNFYFKQSNMYCSSIFGENLARYFVTNDNGKTMQYGRTNKFNGDKSANWENCEQQISNKKQLAEKYDLSILNKMPIYINRQNSRLIKFDRVSNSQYYIISFQFDVTKMPQSYIDIAFQSGNIDSISFNSMKLTYYVSKLDGYLRKVERTESYSASRDAINVDMISSYQSTYTIMNKAISGQERY